jgi:hypothetical protein
MMALLGIIAAYRFCKKNGININTLPGIFEMYRQVFSFKNKTFSLFILICTYGPIPLVFALFILTQWGEGQGCTFLVNRNVEQW